jgi:hypothetical protein
MSGAPTPSAIAIDHKDALRQGRLRLGHVDFCRAKGRVGKRQLGHTPGFHPVLQPFSSQNACDKMKLSLIKGRVDSLPVFIDGGEAHYSFLGRLLNVDL